MAHNKERYVMYFEEEYVISERYKAPTERIGEFISENEISTEDLEKAYLMALETPLRSINSNDTTKDKLVKLISDEFDAGLPISVVGSIVALLRHYERVVPDFIDFVRGLKTTEREKEVLESVVKECRQGELVVSSVDDSCTIKIIIPNSETGITSRDIAQTVLSELRFIIGEKINITFES